MMISKNQGGFGYNTYFGVFSIILATLMIVDVLTGGLFREAYLREYFQYAVFGTSMIVMFSDLIKESDPGGRLLRAYSRHGL